MLVADVLHFTFVVSLNEEAVSVVREADRSEQVRGIYSDLRRLARILLRRESRSITLAPTALAHEVVIYLMEHAWHEASAPTEFMAIAARKMRFMLVDHARAKMSAKRGGRQVRNESDPEQLTTDRDLEGSLVVGLLLEELEIENPRAARVVDMRFFAGFTEPETAAAIGVSLTTVQADWAAARAWLRNRLSKPGSGGSRVP